VSPGIHDLNYVNSSGDDTQIYESNCVYFKAYNDAVNSSECGVSNVWLMSGE
jgi:hypothetical protein